MIRFIEVINETNFNPRMERRATPRFTLGEVWINEKYIVSIKESIGHKSLLREGLLPLDLEEGHRFTSVVTNSGGVMATHVVVGSPEIVAQRLSPPRRALLKG